jgi:hypothetical protein
MKEAEPLYTFVPLNSPLEAEVLHFERAKNLR